MTAFAIDIVVRASALLAAAALIDLFLRRRASAAARHLLWTLAVVALLALPIASSELPAWLVRIPIARETVPVQRHTGAAPPNAVATYRAAPRAVPVPGTAAPGRSSAPVGLPRLTLSAVTAALAVVYAAGVLLLLAGLAVEPFALRRLTRASREVTDPAWRRLLDDASDSMVGNGRVIRLLQTDRNVMPLTFGTLAPVVVLPASADEWTEDRRRAVLLHELAHIARADCLIQRLTACACALYWPHPGVWYAARRLRAERELACDDRVIAAGAPARDYADHLLEIAHAFRAAPAPATALGMARARQLERRLLAILDDARNRASIGRGRRSVIVVAAILVFVPIAVLRAVLVPADPAQTAASSAGASAAQEFTGTWEVHPSDRPGQVQLTIRRGRSTHGRTLPLAELERLAGTTISTATTVHFPIRREAGTFTIDGTCRNGACAGTFGFEPSATFAAELTKRGIGRPTPEDQFHLAVGDVGAAYLDALSAAGYRTPDVRTLVRAAQHGVDLGYLRDMSALGYRFGTIDELIRLRDHGVDPEYVRGLAALGYRNLGLDALVNARDHGVDPEYVRGMQALGHDLTLDQHIRARDHGVDPEYVRGMQALGYSGLSLDALVGARDHGVDPEYTRAMTDLGYKGVPLDSLIRMRDHGVDPAYVRRLQKRGVSNLSVDELIRRRDRGDDR
jgi:beta-lactamase regulating signal transducer with metallopeptidase domain